MTNRISLTTPSAIRQRIATLRRDYGVQDWLTVVSGVTADAYRAAGFRGEEFGELLRDQMEQRGMLSIHLRRKAIMRLRPGFDGHSGRLFDEDGLVDLNLYFDDGSYRESPEPAIRTNGTLPSWLQVAGGLGRSAETVLAGKLPRCLRRVRMIDASTETMIWGVVNTVRMDRSYESLASMPIDVARDLGVAEQRHLAHLPWLGVESAPPPATEVRPDPQPATRPRARPRLRLVD